MATTLSGSLVNIAGYLKPRLTSLAPLCKVPFSHHHHGDAHAHPV
ncbi:hypothetical protein EIKCOROL_02238 [Eikenella corrodens ATCC 23834]|uniref:Uncharacterized protein n=1 Tax=Eikenella corrodens ATCC 23834 TaxID=546274 RepID=C0DXX6_EIKCO|nr:hypothetical protein EIKCOROL_02238 [Eikenella corrodens ATCC 23834]